MLAQLIYLLCFAGRYEDLVAQGVELHQASMPSTSSFSNISAASHDIAPDTPHRSPTHPPSPTHRDSHPASSAFNSMHQQEGRTAQANGSRGSQQAPAIDDCVDQDKLQQHSYVRNTSPNVQRGVGSSQTSVDGRQLSNTEQASSDVEMQIRHSATSHVHAHSQTDHSQRAVAALPKMLPLGSDQKRKNSMLEEPNSPLLASSNGTLLSDKLADASQLLSQDVMLRHHQEEQAEVHTAGLSKVAVETGFRNAGKVSMVDGTSEPVTEALEALSPGGKGPEEATGAADDKARMMKVS